MVWLLQQLVRRIGPNQPKGAKRPLCLQLYIGLELGSSLWQPVSFQRIGSRGGATLAHGSSGSRCQRPSVSATTRKTRCCNRLSCSQRGRGSSRSRCREEGDAQQVPQQ